MKSPEIKKLSPKTYKNKIINNAYAPIIKPEKKKEDIPILLLEK
jgi:hypothetical protein